MAFDLGGLSDRVRRHEADGQSLSLSWTHGAISPNYGKATTHARFEGAGWIGQVSVWATGETELESIHLSDGKGVNNHYDLTDAGGLEAVLTDLVGLIRDGTIPQDAFTYSAP